MHGLTSMRAAPRILALLLAGTLLAAGCTPVEKDPWAGDHFGGGRPSRTDGGDWPALQPIRHEPDGLGDMNLPPWRLERPRPQRPIVMLPRSSVVIGTALPSVPMFPMPSRTRRRRHRSARTVTP